MGLAANIAGGAAVQIVVAFLLVTVGIYACLWAPASPRVFFRLKILPSSTISSTSDELELTLRRTSMGNKTLIISVLNSAYVEENGMLDFFLRSLREGENTEYLVKHILFVTVDQMAFQRCKLLRLHCYKLVSDGIVVSEETLFMSANSIKMMWNITFFLGNVLRRGYNFIFTDIDVMWLRNPFTKLSHAGEDMQISCDSFNGHPRT